MRGSDHLISQAGWKRCNLIYLSVYLGVGMQVLWNTQADATAG